MLHELDIEHWNKVAYLFESHILAQSVINPCIHSGMGSLSVNDVESPKVALYSTPMMIFIAGDWTNPAASELIKLLPPLTIVVVPDENWSNLLKSEFGKRLVVNHRTHLDHKSLDITHLRKLKKCIPEGYTLKELDLDMLPQINHDYAIQILMYFGKIENLVKSGFGFGIIDDRNKLASYAYTPFPFIDQFEIQVFTKNSPKYRRKELATVVSAALIEYGLEKGLVPHWDAANDISVKLALKLGYSNPKTWEAFYYKPK
ncbi:MAG: GNAT family N-acetyltransferase [Candidatus Thorarchaeota archaeon]